MSFLKDFFNNSSLHGLKYLSEPGRHWIERLFWLVCITASWYFCSLLVVSSYNGLIDHPLSFGTETDYIDWNTTFFSVAVCESKNKPPVNALGEKMYGPNHDPSLDEVLLEIAYFKGDHYFIKTFCKDGPRTLPCPQDNFRNISEMVRTECRSVFVNCAWRDQPFNCCYHFQLLATERGRCFALNSFLDSNSTTLDMTCNKKTGRGMLHLELNIPADVYVLAQDEVPYINARAHSVVTAQKGVYKSRSYTIVEIKNGPFVQNVDVDKRRCRFKEENTLVNYRYYSYMACVVSCRAQRQYDLCGCYSHFTPEIDPSKHCNLTGLLCLIENFSKYSELVSSWNAKHGLYCECYPGCTEPEIKLVSQQDYKDTSDRAEIGTVELSLERLPSLRLNRIVVKTPLDIVVSMGGSVGLFLGASLLSFVELVYFCAIRPWWKLTSANSRWY